MDRSTAIKIALAFLFAAGAFVGLFVLAGLLLENLLDDERTPAVSDFSDDDAGNPRRRPSVSPGDVEPIPPPTETQRRRIATLLEGLAASAYDERRKAEAELVSMGAVAIPDLEQALAHPDPEVRWRAGEAIRRIREGK